MSESKQTVEFSTCETPAVEVVTIEAGSPLQKALVNNLEAQKQLDEVIHKLLSHQKKMIREEINKDIENTKELSAMYASNDSLVTAASLATFERVLSLPSLTINEDEV